jgi:hypothetical protein
VDRDWHPIFPNKKLVVVKEKQAYISLPYNCLSKRQSPTDEVSNLSEQLSEKWHP